MLGLARWSSCRGSLRAVVRIAGYSGVDEAKKAFSPAFDAAYTDLLQRKLGLTALKLGSNWVDVLSSEADEANKATNEATNEATREASPDAQFVLELFRLMAGCRADFTDTWRALIDVPTLSVALNTTRSSGVPLTGGHGRRAGVDASPCEGARDSDEDRRGKGRDSAGNKNGSVDGNGREWEMSDDELLRPLRDVLKASGASSTQMRGWATWTREYMARIDFQVRWHGRGHTFPKLVRRHAASVIMFCVDCALASRSLGEITFSHTIAVLQHEPSLPTQHEKSNFYV